jgi:cytochrome P450
MISHVRPCPSIPRFLDANALRDNPLALLRAARAAAGDIVVVAEGHSVFSRARDCPAAIAVFGRAGVQQVLGDADLFGTAVSVGEQLALPSTLNRLNLGLFSMKGQEHRTQQQLLRTTLDAACRRDAGDFVAEGWTNFAQDLRVAEEIPLLTEMRRLVLHISTRMIFGTDDLALGRLVQSYFELRRRVSAARGAIELPDRRALIQMGGRLDRLLHARLQALRLEIASGAHPARNCVAGRLCAAATEQPGALTEDQLVAQANTLFMSSSEPIAVSLTWILLLLSQQPQLRDALRREHAETASCDEEPAWNHETDHPLLRATILETLRLLPPNAIMVRRTTRPAELLGHALPANCEILLSPFVAHRDQQEFPRPDSFDPARWRGWKPATYAYFPFGLGARYCIGRQIAQVLLASALTSILTHYDVVLASSQELDWTMNVTMMPAQDPLVRFLLARQHAATGGALRGPVAELVRF